MKRTTISSTPKVVLFSLLFIFLLPCFTLAQDNVQQMDSLKIKIQTLEGEEKADANNRLMLLLSQYERDADTILYYMRQYYEDCIKSENYARAGNILRNTHSMYRNFGMYDESLKIIEKDLDFLAKYELWNVYYDLCRKYAETLEQKGNFGKAMEVANQMYNRAQKNNHKSGMVSSLYAIGLLHSYHGRCEDAIVFFKEALQIADQLDEIPADKFNIYLQHVNAMLEAKNSSYLSEIPEILTKWEADIKKWSESFGNYNAKYHWLSFYSQNLAYYKKGDVNYDKIAEYCNLMEAMLQEHDILGFYHCYGARYTLAEKDKDWVKMLYYAEQKLDLGSKFGPGQECQSQGEMLRALIYLNRADEAIESLEKYVALKDTINNESISKQLSELRTQYEVDKITAEKEQKQQQVIWAVAVCALLFVALFIYILYSRRLKQRNLALYQQVQELSRKEKAVESCFLSKPEETLTKEMLLFRQLNECMKTEKLFVNMDINRKTVADHLGTNENYLASAIRAVRAETFSDYISNLRLQHALELLNDNPDMTFEAIAIDSGHGSYSQFFRTFSKKYGISPSEYRKLSVSEIRHKN